MILDIHALSAVVDGDPAIEPRFQSAAFLAIPVIVLGEYQYGFSQSRRRASYERWMDYNLASYRVFAIDEGTAERYAEIRQELKLAATPIPANDLWIAALARQHRVAVLSRDRHFDAVKGLRRVAW